MTSTLRRHATSLLITALLIGLAAPAPAADRWFHVRVIDPMLQDALDRGYERSTTFRQLLHVLEASDLVVYVAREPMPGRADGATQFLGSAGGLRFLRITLRTPLLADGTIALLGHELRHAAEVAAAPWVVDEHGYGVLYEHIGVATCVRPQRCFDTQAAVDTGREVLRELRRGARVVEQVRNAD